MIPKGTKVICPTCRAVIAETTEDLYSGMKLAAHSFNGVQQDIREGQRTTCLNCSSNWFDWSYGKIHTGRGWVSWK